MMTVLDTNNRHTFVLRVWREDGGIWRVMLQHARTRISYGFRSLEEAFAFVESLCTDGDTE